MAVDSNPIYRFGDYLFNPTSGELTKANTPLRLQEQPAKVLLALIERHNQIVPRQDLHQILWPDGVNVDFEAGLNATMRRLRQALLDEAERPRYIETIPKRGYRFIAAVEVINNTPPASDPPQPPTVDRRWFWAAGAATLTAGATALARLYRPTSRPSIQSSILIPPGQSLVLTSGRTVAISQDSSRLAYIASLNGRRSMFRRSLAPGNLETIDSSRNPTTLSFQADGRQLLWVSPEGLYREQQSKPETLHLWPGGASIYSLTLTPENDLLFPVPSPGGKLATTCLYWLKGQPKPTPIQIPYGGKGIETLIPLQVRNRRFLLYNSILGPQTRSLWVLDMVNGRRTELLPRAMGAWLLPEDRIVYFWDGNLMLANIDFNSLEIKGQPRPVLSGVAVANWSGPNADLSLDGTLIYTPERPIPEWKPFWMDLNGKKTPIQVPPGPFQVADLSSDGRHILLAQRRSGGTANLFHYDLSTGATKPLASEVDLQACWVEGIRKVALSRVRPGAWLSTFQILNLASGQIEFAAPFDGLARLAAQYVDSTGDLYFVEGFHPESQIDINMVNLRDSARAIQPVAGGPGSQSHPRVSPDGHLLAYVDATYGSRIHIRAASNPTPTVIVDGTGVTPMWSRDSRTLYFVSGRAIQSVEVSHSPLRVSRPKTLFEADFLPATQWDRNIFFDSTQSRFLMAEPSPQPEDFRRIDVITNWPSTLG